MITRSLKNKPAHGIGQTQHKKELAREQNEQDQKQVPMSASKRHDDAVQSHVAYVHYMYMYVHLHVHVHISTTPSHNQIHP